MEINYAIVIPVFIVVVLLILFLMFRNNKDRKKYEKDAAKSEIKPDQHDGEKI